MEFSLPHRDNNSHKGTFGKVLNIAGSKYMSGAAYLSSVSALKIGCGYCFLASCDEVIQSVSAQTQNVVFVPIKEVKKHILNSDVISIGCGLSVCQSSKNLFKEVIKHATNQPIVIDADGLNILSELKIELHKNAILTPHPKEASRLLNRNVEEILKDLPQSARDISKKYNCITVLKSHNTIVCSANFEIYQNTTGNSALAKAGSGDVLTGMIAGLLAQKMEHYEATKLAVYLHGLCGELASQDLTEYSVMAKDLIEYIPKAIKQI